MIAPRSAEPTGGGLEIESASRKGAAFVFIKPHAVTEQVKGLVRKRFGAEGTSSSPRAPS